MSTAHHDAGASKAPAGKSRRSRRHRVRNLILAVTTLIGLALWQLGPVIQGVAAVEHGLQQAEGTRSVLAGFIHAAIRQAQATLGPLLQHLVH
ncbi:MAG: hypothetical protein M0Z53_09670 [Thermaerobacter sp.]|nr:hypothetical protein [Thermaerobacter sp.]